MERWQVPKAAGWSFRMSPDRATKGELRLLTPISPAALFSPSTPDVPPKHHPPGGPD